MNDLEPSALTRELVPEHSALQKALRVALKCMQDTDTLQQIQTAELAEGVARTSLLLALPKLHELPAEALIALAEKAANISSKLGQVQPPHSDRELKMIMQAAIGILQRDAEQ